MNAASRREPRFARRLGRRLVEPFPPVAGNALLAFERGPDFFDRMLRAIGDARVTVDVEMYLWDDDEVGRGFVAALVHAARRGLRVRVLVDANGASEVIEPLRRVDEAGGDVRIFNPLRVPFLHRFIHRTHKKLLVCDGELAFTGGAGFSLWFSSGKRREQPWHDRMFAVRGPVVAQLVRLFETDFHRWRMRAEPSPRELPDVARDLAPPGTATLRVLRGWPDAFDFPATLVGAIRNARERVWLGSPYFIPPPSLTLALRRALRRGVDVRLVLPSGNYAHPLLWHASRRHYGFFLKRGARIYEFVDAFYHAKLAVVDGDTAIVGSSNLDYWSFDRNAEIDLVATDAAAVAAFARAFEDDVARSREVTRRDVGMTSWLQRLLERATGWIEDWL